MIFTIVINQQKAIEWELNLQQSAVLCYCHNLYSWADMHQSDGKTWYYSTKSKLVDELPLLTTKIDTAYRLLSQLEEKGLIECKVVSNKSFIHITPLGMQWNRSDKNPILKSEGSDINPSRVGELSVSGSDKYPNNNNTINNKTIISNTSSKKSIKSIEEKKLSFRNLLHDYAKRSKIDYPLQAYTNFFNYWTESNGLNGSTKLRFEDQKFFDIGRRLATFWKFVKEEDKNAWWKQEEQSTPTKPDLFTDLAKSKSFN